jgi:hypothetical protein
MLMRVAFIESMVLATMACLASSRALLASSKNRIAGSAALSLGRARPCLAGGPGG